jgi:hypothetical protein
MTDLRAQTGSFAYARYQLKRSILENAVANNYTKRDREEALEYFGGCAFCGSNPAPRNDHLIPVVDCGDRTRNNIVPACQPCDDSKGRKEYHEWMREASSLRSLKRNRNLTLSQIETRIKLIEKWQAGYKSKTEAEVFGKSYKEYKEILQKMDALCIQAKKLTDRVRSNKESPVINTTIERQCRGNNADEIRQFVLDNYIIPARLRNERNVTIRAGDIHSDMNLHWRYPNVCQVLRGNIFLTMANLEKISETGPKFGGNTYFTYNL